MSFIGSNLGATICYGAAALTAFGLATASKAAPLQKTAMILLGSWAVSNILFGTMAPPRLLTANAVMDLCGLWLCLHALKGDEHRNSRFFLSMTYVAMLTCHVGWLLFNNTTFGSYFATINFLFAIQLLLSGGGSINVIAANIRLDRMRRDLDHWHASGHSRHK